MENAYKSFAYTITTVNFASLPGTTAAATEYLGGDIHGANNRYVVTLDMTKITNLAQFTVDLAHEGTHMADLQAVAYGALPNVTSLFQLEYRAYIASSEAAQAFSVHDLTIKGVTVWSDSWPASQRATLRDQNVTAAIALIYPDDPTHAEVQPHDPYPNY